VLGGYAVSFDDIKYRPGSDFQRQPYRRLAYHYFVLGHLNTCDSGTHCAACPPDRANGTLILVGSSGTAEYPGNDFMVTPAALYFGISAIPQDVLSLSGIFMHELGHNLGLHHGGQDFTNYKPNYLSVMNYNHTYSGITTADVPGSVVPDPALTRLDYSETAFATLNEAALDESAGISPLSAGNRDIGIYYDLNNDQQMAATSGPVDWTGNGTIDAGLVRVDLNFDGDDDTTLLGSSDWDEGACTTDQDCPYSTAASLSIGKATNLPCVQGRCQGLLLAYQCYQWGMADGESPAKRPTITEPAPEELMRKHLLLTPRPVDIQISPGCSQSSIAAGQIGVAKVALLGSALFNVNDVDRASLSFHGAKPASISIRDVNGDGFPDLLLEFSTVDVHLSPRATRAHLTGWLKNSQAFIGEDKVTVVSNVP